MFESGFSARCSPAASASFLPLQTWPSGSLFIGGAGVIAVLTHRPVAVQKTTRPTSSAQFQRASTRGTPAGLRVEGDVERENLKRCAAQVRPVAHLRLGDRAVFSAMVSNCCPLCSSCRCELGYPRSAQSCRRSAVLRHFRCVASTSQFRFCAWRRSFPLCSAAFAVWSKSCEANGSGEQTGAFRLSTSNE